MELRLAVLLPLLRGDWYIVQGLRQFSFEPLTRGSELSLLFNKLDLVFVLEDEIIGVDEVTEDCLENCPQHDKAATSKGEAVDL